MPYLSQTEDLCGGAAVAMVLRYWGERQVFAEDFARLVDRSAAGIRTDALVEAVRDRGWQALPFRGRADDVRHHLDRGRPLLALIEDRPGRYHYVVIVGWVDEQVIAHDPARTPLRVLPRAEFEQAWAAAAYWTLLALPPEAAPPQRGGDATSGANPPTTAPPLIDGCGALVEEGVRLARRDDFAGAEERLLAAARLCPGRGATWRELAGLRFRQSRWREVTEYAGRAAQMDPNDSHAWELLATARFLEDDIEAALAAWNRLERPRIDLLQVEGARRTRRPVIAETLGLRARDVLTPALFRRAQRRLSALPAAGATRLTYRPVEGDLVEIEAVVQERAAAPRGFWPLAALGVQAVVAREVGVELAGPTGSGELWSLSWRWWENRPRAGFELAIPSPGPLPGVTRLEASWERQTYGVPVDRPNDGPAHDVLRDARSRAAVGIADWATGNLWWTAAAAFDRWEQRRHVGLEGALDFRLLADRMSIGAAGAVWRPMGGGASFARTDLSSAWRSSRESSRPAWLVSGGLATAGTAAPPDIWPGAGAGPARAPLLRAHPLLDRGIVRGEVFGRRLAHATAEYRHPLRTTLAGRVGAAVFIDAARAWQGFDGAQSAIHVDGGTGLRVALPGHEGTLRLDLARGLRDGRMALSAGWQARWGGT